MCSCLFGCILIHSKSKEEQVGHLREVFKQVADLREVLSKLDTLEKCLRC